MKEFSRAIGLIIFLICFLSVKAYSSTDKIQTYVSKGGYSTLLFAQQIGDSIKVEPLDSIKLKDPKMAVFYAIIPGIVVHGSGHFYAREKATGWILVAGEVLSITMLTYSIGVGIGKSTDGSTSNGGGDVIAVAGATLFIGTWIYDIIGAPLAVQKQNQILLRGKSANLKFEFNDKGDFIKIVFVRQF